MRIYIAGALNDNAAEYIQNLHRMNIHAEKVRKTGVAVYVPCNDFLQGVIIGDWTYEDYVENTMAFLEICDAISLTPGWKTSKGTRKEIKKAKKLGIPVLYTISDLINFIMDNKE